MSKQSKPEKNTAARIRNFLKENPRNRLVRTTARELESNRHFGQYQLLSDNNIVQTGSLEELEEILRKGALIRTKK